MRPDSGGVPIRADPSLAEPGNVDVVVLSPILDGLAGRAPRSDRVAESVPQRMFC
jgi:hypothetical protein